MEKLGYIVSDKKIKGLKDFIGLVDDFSLADPTKPILIVGIDNAKKHSEKFCILDRKLKDNVFWTFKKTEKREFFERDVEWFSGYIINNIIDNIKYYYVNIINLKYSKIKRLYNIIFSGNTNYIYIFNNMIYIYYSGNILGISLNILKYCGINKSKVINKIKNSKNNVICDNDCEIIAKISRDIGENKYITPYFMSISQ